MNVLGCCIHCEGLYSTLNIIYILHETEWQPVVSSEIGQLGFSKRSLGNSSSVPSRMTHETFPKMIHMFSDLPHTVFGYGLVKFRQLQLLG